MSKCAIFTILQKVCYNFLPMLSNLILSNNPNATEKCVSFDLWDFVSINLIEPGVSSQKMVKSKNINKKHEVEQ